VYQGHNSYLPFRSLALWVCLEKVSSHEMTLRRKKWNMRGIRTRYYTTRLHQGAFALPAYVEEMLREVE